MITRQQFQNSAAKSLMCSWDTFLAKKKKVEHLQYFQLKPATSDVLPNAVKKAIQDCPRDNLSCSYSDGPRVTKSLKRQLEEHVIPAAIDIGECSLHKMQHAFWRALAAFGGDVAAALVDNYRNFRNSARKKKIFAKSPRCFLWCFYGLLGSLVLQFHCTLRLWVVVPPGQFKWPKIACSKSWKACSESTFFQL